MKFKVYIYFFLQWKERAALILHAANVVLIAGCLTIACLSQIITCLKTLIWEKEGSTAEFCDDTERLCKFLNPHSSFILQKRTSVKSTMPPRWRLICVGIKQFLSLSKGCCEWLIQLIYLIWKMTMLQTMRESGSRLPFILRTAAFLPASVLIACVSTATPAIPPRQ